MTTPGTATEDALMYWPKFLGDLISPSWLGGGPVFTHFKVGEGGWTDPGTGAIPRTPPESDLRYASGPDVGLQDIDALVDPFRAAADQRYPTDSRASFTKALIPSDFSFVAPNILRVRLFLDFGEFNDDGFGNSPEIWEAAVFSPHPTVSGKLLMVGYTTFPKVTKDAGRQLENAIDFPFRMG